MQKWEEKHKQKMHQHKILNAKSSLKTYSTSKEKQSSSRIKQTINSQCVLKPIPKILQIFSFQKYAPLLNQFGFPGFVCNQNYQEDLDKMLKEVEEEDKEKFIVLLNTLIVMTKGIQKQINTPKSKNKSISQSRKVHYPPQPSQYSKQSKNEAQKSEKITIKSQSKKQNELNNSITIKNQSKRNLQSSSNSRASYRTRECSTSTKHRKRSTTCIDSKATDDLYLVHDFTIIDNVNESGILRPIKETNKILNRLSEKLTTLSPHIQSPNLNLEIEKIKNMYLSFDSATLTSNIVNIDMHQMIMCLASEIKQMIVKEEIEKLIGSNKEEIKNLLKESFVGGESFKKLHAEVEMERKVNVGKEMDFEVPIRKLKKRQEIENESIELKCVEKIPQKQNNGFKISLEDLSESLDKSEFFPSESTFPKLQLLKMSQSPELPNNFASEENDRNTSIDMSDQYEEYEEETQDLMKESSLWGNSCIQSIIKDFTCFDSLNNQHKSSYETDVRLEDIRNFIELVIMSGKMEKEVTIISYIYLQKLVNLKLPKSSKITEKNWKNLVLITLIEASKIWDDQSLENNTFAELIHPYTTLEINRLEKYLVYLLDYRLTIEQKEYSEAYFKLRSHIWEHEGKSETANLMRLDIKAIQKLQNMKGYGNDKQLKKNLEKKYFLEKLLNQSF